MTIIDEFKNRLSSIEASEEETKSFTSTAIQADNKKRVYNLLNTNIKTINTYSKYLKDIEDNPLEDHHQKYAILRQLNVYRDIDDSLSSDEIQRFDVRKSILLKAYSRFPEKSSFIRTFITFLLALKSGYNLFDGTEYLLDSLPDSLISSYDNYLKQVINDPNVDITNPVFGLYVVYSDPELFDLYVDLFSENNSLFSSAIIPYVNNALLQKRITNCQKSALRTESLLFSLYLLISGLEIDGFDYDKVINTLCLSLEEKIKNIDLNEHNRLFYYKKGEINSFKCFLEALSINEKNEILSCLGNDKTTGSIKSFDRDKKVPVRNNSALTSQGYDAETRTKSRRGQQRFKKALFDSLHGKKPKCAICGCEINGKNHLIASHILPWNKANSQQKVDPNNGLLLCSNHDLLFDSLLISFDENGKIIISDELNEENKRGYRISSTTKIDTNSEREEYMKLHREAFKKKGWNK